MSRDERSAFVPQDASVTFPPSCVCCLDPDVVFRDVEGSSKAYSYDVPPGSFMQREIETTRQVTIRRVPYCAPHAATLDAWLAWNRKSAWERLRTRQKNFMPEPKPLSDGRDVWFSRLGGIDSGADGGSLGMEITPKMTADPPGTELVFQNPEYAKGFRELNSLRTVKETEAARKAGRTADFGTAEFELAVETDTEREHNRQMEGIRRLGEHGDERAVEPLIAALGRMDWMARVEAAKALGKLGDSRAVEPLFAVLRSKDFSWSAQAQGAIRVQAAAALGKLGDSRAVEPLIAALRSKVPRVGLDAAEALGELGDLRAVEPLTAALGSEFPAVRVQAAKALGELGDPRALDPLIALLQADQPQGDQLYVRLAAAQALGALGDERAVEPLNAALEDRKRKVRRAAADALEQIDRYPARRS